MVVLSFYVLVFKMFKIFVLLAPYVCFHILVKFRKLSGHLLEI